MPLGQDAREFLDGIGWVPFLHEGLGEAHP